MKTAKNVDFRHALYAAVRMRRFYSRRFLHGTFPRPETRFPAKSTVNLGDSCLNCRTFGAYMPYHSSMVLNMRSLAAFSPISPIFGT